MDLIHAAPPRVAFLSVMFHEVNGAARTCRELAAFAQRRGYPFLSARFGPREFYDAQDPYWTLEIRRGPVSVKVDPDLRFDLAFYQRRGERQRRLREFRPDLIHVIGPGELGILGAIAAHVMHIPLVASGQTNVHEYAKRRSPWRNSSLGDRIEGFVLDQILRIYGRAAAMLAPSPELWLYCNAGQVSRHS